jgi:hypothetical protein
MPETRAGLAGPEDAPPRKRTFFVALSCSITNAASCQTRRRSEKPVCVDELGPGAQGAIPKIRFLCRTCVVVGCAASHRNQRLSQSRPGYLVSWPLYPGQYQSSPVSRRSKHDHQRPLRRTWHQQRYQACNWHQRPLRRTWHQQRYQACNWHQQPHQACNWHRQPHQGCRIPG